MRMKANYYITGLFLITGISAFAQIDNKQDKVFPLTLGDTPKKADSAMFDTTLKLSKPINADAKVNGLTVPKPVTLKPQTSEFSMFGENFGNPAELYQDRIDQQKSSIETITKGESDILGNTEDVSWGNLKTKSKYVIICYRDYGAFDGDYVRILLDKDILEGSYLLTPNFKKKKIELLKGENRIDFIAINEGESAPNTGEFVVIDESGTVIFDDFWGLRSNVKSTLIIERVE